MTDWDEDIPHFVASFITSFDIKAEFPKRLDRFAPTWSHTFADPEVTLWENWLGEHDYSVFITGHGNEPGLIDQLVGVLEGAGYGVDRGENFPADMDQYEQIWWLGWNPPFPDSDINRLVQYVDDGGGLFLTGERPCCEDLNQKVSDVVNTLVTTGSVQVGAWATSSTSSGLCRPTRTPSGG